MVLTCTCTFKPIPLMYHQEQTTLENNRIITLIVHCSSFGGLILFVLTSFLPHWKGVKASQHEWWRAHKYWLFITILSRADRDMTEMVDFVSIHHWRSQNQSSLGSLTVSALICTGYPQAHRHISLCLLFDFHPFKEEGKNLLHGFLLCLNWF